MVYTSTSKALACVELFVHLDPSMVPDDLVAVTITLPDEMTVETVHERLLPADWHTADNFALRQLGAEWVRSGRSVALRVPSAVIEGDWNVLLNPAHPDFAKLIPGEPVPFRFDIRMFRS